VDYQKFLELADGGQPPPLALLHGADVQLLDDALAAVGRALFPDPASAPLGREVFDARETSADAVVRAAQTLPLATSRRLVAVRRAQSLAAKNADELIAYLREPSSTTCLLLLADEPLGASRERKTDHWLLQATPPDAVITLPAREGRTLPAWLRQRAALDGLTVSEEAARLLVEWLGEDGATLLGETRKAALAGGPDNRTVSVKEVTAIVGEHRLHDVFELTRAVERRDAPQALRLLDRLLATEEPMRVLALLVNDVRTAWVVCDLTARGQSVEQIARLLRRPPRVIDAVARATTAQRATTLADRLARCWQVEWRLKSSAQAAAELTALVAELCRA
jgi:DNA polymerase III subunit delta